MITCQNLSRDPATQFVEPVKTLVRHFRSQSQDNAELSEWLKLVEIAPTLVDVHTKNQPKLAELAQH